ncbi:MAG: hypothetical protein KatS3mg102_2416 [Planctomycetota bacterium]|nr:MAG: hypothetical protein KatS3mg102_2416 [Planctomycetota bacterium]
MPSQRPCRQVPERRPRSRRTAAHGAHARAWGAAGQAPAAAAGSRLAGPVRRAIEVALGCGFVGLGVLGALLPVLPATPFLLVASYFFARSSPRLHRWLLRSRLFGPLLRDWQRHRGVRLHVKLKAIAVVLVAVALSLGFGGLGPLAAAALLVLAGLGIAVVLRLPTVCEEPR